MALGPTQSLTGMSKGKGKVVPVLNLIKHYARNEYQEFLCG
jgi:hypothetical protein